ncbi:hypothetical protein [Actinoplanes sp. M2I2]|uniref:hypothetical protein n=1 Tax=Actinoplanes sp. M2I2 TaxID=1734444 RepID=UPI002022067B|nr:hypothetical protein [Actinoplanes sp. M2I2]
MTSSIDLERLVRPSDLHGHRGRHAAPGRHRVWLAAVTVAAVLATITAATAS